MATNGALVGIDTVGPHTTAYSAHRTVGSVRPRMRCETRPRQKGGFEGDERGQGVGEVLVVLREPAVAVEPGECALGDPSAGRTTKPLMSSVRLAISRRRVGAKRLPRSPDYNFATG